MLLRLAVFMIAMTPLVAVWGQSAGWPYYGRDAGGSRYSPLDQIKESNLDRLEVAWQFRTGELGEHAQDSDKLTFEATPVFWRGNLYFSTGLGAAFAIDAATGRQIWKFDSRVPRGMNFAEVTSRGVTVWDDPLHEDGSVCSVRVFLGNIVGQLYALDAESGERCLDFGHHGMVNLQRDARPREEGQYAITSPPAIANDRLIVGSAIGDNSAVGVERGIVRALDVRSGQVLWTWDPIPVDPDDPAYATWESGVEQSGGANAWAPISVDVENGLIFVPTGAASPDFYGGQRAGNGVYANSLVALSVETGEVAWYRQLVHHDVWDYDLPVQPLLIELRKDGRTHSAVVQTTKMGMVFVFDRTTGKAVYPIEERPVPQGGVAGERLSPTQPFSTLPALASHAAITEDDAYGLLYFDKRGCRNRLAAYRSKGIYTPPSLEGTLMNPGYAGGSNWGGLAWSPDSQIVVATVMELPMWIRLTPRAAAQKLIDAGEFDWQGYTAMEGTPYVMNRGLVSSVFGVPCTRPPWGKLVALDLGRGEIVWERPIGTIEDIAPAPVPNLELGTPVIGGAIVTGSGLVLVAAAAADYLRAFDFRDYLAGAPAALSDRLIDCKVT